MGQSPAGSGKERPIVSEVFGNETKKEVTPEEAEGWRKLDEEAEKGWARLGKGLPPEGAVGRRMHISPETMRAIQQTPEKDLSGSE